MEDGDMLELAVVAWMELEAIKSWAESDFELAHSRADAVLCDLLKKLGMDDVVEAFEAIPRWDA